MVHYPSPKRETFSSVKIFAARLDTFCNTKILQEEQYGFHPCRSTMDMMSMVHRLQELGRDVRVSIRLCFIDLQKASDSVDPSLLWQVLAGFGAPPELTAVIHQFHDGMRTCVRNDDETYLLRTVRSDAGTAPRIQTIAVIFQYLLCRCTLCCAEVFRRGCPHARRPRPRSRATSEGRPRNSTEMCVACSVGGVVCRRRVHRIAGFTWLGEDYDDYCCVFSAFDPTVSENTETVCVPALHTPTTPTVLQHCQINSFIYL